MVQENSAICPDGIRSPDPYGKPTSSHCKSSFSPSSAWTAIASAWRDAVLTRLSRSFHFKPRVPTSSTTFSSKFTSDFHSVSVSSTSVSANASFATSTNTPDASGKITPPLTLLAASASTHSPSNVSARPATSFRASPSLSSGESIQVSHLGSSAGRGGSTLVHLDLARSGEIVNHYEVNIKKESPPSGRSTRSGERSIQPNALSSILVSCNTGSCV
jgi:hypothetical protein